MFNGEARLAIEPASETAPIFTRKKNLHLHFVLPSFLKSSGVHLDSSPYKTIEKIEPEFENRHHLSVTGGSCSVRPLTLVKTSAGTGIIRASNDNPTGRGHDILHKPLYFQKYNALSLPRAGTRRKKGSRPGRIEQLSPLTNKCWWFSNSCSIKNQGCTPLDFGKENLRHYFMCSAKDRM